MERFDWSDFFSVLAVRLFPISGVTFFNDIFSDKYRTKNTYPIFFLASLI